MKGPRFFKGFITALMLATLVTADLSDINVLQETVNEEEDSATREFNEGTLSAKLSDLRAESVNCIKVSGVNAQGFGSCCGHNYENLSQKFFAIYKSVENYLMASFNQTVIDACWVEEKQEPCVELLKFAQEAVEDDENKFQAIVEKAEQVKDMPGVDEHLVDEAVGGFRQRYGVFRQTRSVIAAYLFDTVHDVEQYIEHSGVPANFDYRSFNPLKVFDDIGIIDSSEYKYDPEWYKTHKADRLGLAGLEQNLGKSAPAQTGPTLAPTGNRSSLFRKNRRAQSDGSLIRTEVLRPISTDSLSVEDKLNVIQRNVDAIIDPLLRQPKKLAPGEKHNFNKGLLDEVEARQLVNYYLARGLVDKAKVDLSLLPSDILKEIQLKKLLIDTKSGH